MSGGHFNYEDARALETVSETLAEDIGKIENLPEYNRDMELQNIKVLLQASLIMKQWLHDYDWHVSGDSSRFDESSAIAIIQLRALTNQFTKENP